MFDDYAQVEATGNVPCRPDPEKTLERLRLSIKEVQDSLDKAFALGKTRIPNNKEIADGMKYLVGSLTIRMWELNIQVENTLKQIDKEAEEVS